MLHHCFNEPKECFFLQKRAGFTSPAEKYAKATHNSRLQEKKSLKTVKSIRSHKSLKTIDSETQRDRPGLVTLRVIPTQQKTPLKDPEIQKELITYQSPFLEKVHQLKSRNRLEKKLSFPLPRPINRVSINFGYDVTLRKYLSPQPTEVMGKFQMDQPPRTPEVPCLNLGKLLKRSSRLSDMKEVAESVLFKQSPEGQSGLSTVREDDKDWDMKSTHHVDQQNLEIPMPLPSKAKSTVSMISDRSECDSVVMGRLPVSGKLTKLL